MGGFPLLSRCSGAASRAKSLKSFEQHHHHVFGHQLQRAGRDRMGIQEEGWERDNAGRWHCVNQSQCQVIADWIDPAFADLNSGTACSRTSTHNNSIR